jgi:hypothetical protein
MVESQARAARLWGLADKSRREPGWGKPAAAGVLDQRDAAPVRVALAPTGRAAGME